MLITVDLIEVYTPTNPAQLTILKQLLADERIETYVVNDGMEGVMGEVPFDYARPRIWVKTTEALQARAICEAFDKRLQERARGAETDESPFCYHCGETVDLSISICPACDGQID